jgi:hypothetical protein
LPPWSGTGRDLPHFHHAEYWIGVAFVLMGSHRDALQWLEAAARDGFPCYLALARADTAEVWRRLAYVTHWQDINVVLSRLYAAQGKDSAAADIIEGEAWEGPRNVLQRLLQAQVAERLDRPDEALRSYQFVADMWRRADPELLPYVAEARAGLTRLSGEGGP